MASALNSGFSGLGISPTRVGSRVVGMLLSQCLSSPWCMDTGKFNARGSPVMDLHPIQVGSRIFLVASCYRNRDKLQPDGPLGLFANFNITSPYLY